jgi:hypothetical protein
LGWFGYSFFLRVLRVLRGLHILTVDLGIAWDLKIETKRGKMELNLKKENKHETIRNIYMRPVDDKFDRLRRRGR